MLIFVIVVTTATVGTADEKIDFSSQVKPILSDKCFACHGPDEKQRTTDFRLDQKESALSAEYSVIVPSKPDASLLVERILSKDLDEVMPPADHLKQLNDAQKQILVKWIEQGANWTRHWAFEKPVATPDPKVVDSDWPRNYIDRYILERLEKRHIQPSAPAQPHTLLRRLHFDLTGLPPSPTDVREFMELRQAIGPEKAYQQTVEQLLASPHFGERMAVYWLDLVRYADTVGYHGDQDVSVSPYRDYVINAFNENMPFDQFTREQLAGDLLADRTQDQLIASGYNRLGMMSAEGGVQPEEYLNKYASDRVRTTAAVWLGVTLGCAECHDHKFDPFGTKEFYEFSAFFADIKEQGLYAGAHQTGKWGTALDIPDPELPELLEPIDAEIAKLKSTLRETDEVKADRESWENSIRAHDFNWTTLTPLSIKTMHPVDVNTNQDDSVLVNGKNPDQETYLVTTNVDSDSKSFRLEVLPHKSLPKQGPGRAGNGNFVVTELIAIPGDPSSQFETLKQSISQWPEELRAKTIRFKNASATIEQEAGGNSHPDKKWSAASAIDLDARGSSWGWAILPESGKPNELVVQLQDDQPLPEQVTFVIQQFHGQGSHTLGHFRLSQSQSADATAEPTRKLPDSIQSIVKLKETDRTAEQKKQISDYYISIAPRYEATRKKIADLTQQHETIAQQHTRPTLITVSVKPREIRVLARGNWMDKTGEIVQPDVPDILGGKNWDDEALADNRPTRLELANWIVDENNPLTARVFVNRTWRMFMGSGISNVLDDLGSQGEPPSHPELLDRLAIEFVNSDWDIKQLVREIVNSNTYRQSSQIRNDLKEIDPENRLLARQSRFRLDAEFIRDHALAVSDLLVRELGGRSVKPYQPVGLLRHLNFPTRTYQPSKGKDQYRRGVYTHWQRQFLHPAMKTFDAPPREECTAARPRSSTPLAALVLLNDPSYVEAARALADLAIQNQADTAARIDWIFERAFSRVASEEEKAVMTELLQSHQEYFSQHTDEAKQLVSIGGQLDDAKENATGVSAAERAAWTSICRAVINMHEFVLRK